MQGLTENHILWRGLPVKRSFFIIIITFRNIVGGNMLRAFEHPVATCWVLPIELVRMPRRDIVLRTCPNDYNIMEHPQMLRQKFDHFQIWDNNPPHVAACRNRVAKRAQHAAPSNIVAICSVQRCCYRLAGASSSY